MAVIGQQLTAPEPGWSRNDDTHAYLSYSSTNFALASDANAHNSTYHGLKTGNTTDFVTFKFKGTKIRIIGYMSPTNYSESIAITIDGSSENFSQSGGAAGVYKTLNYEKIGLPNVVHTVKIQSNVAKTFMIDAIDIDDTGYIVAQIGNQLTAPEPEWKRLDSSCGAFSFGSGWGYATDNSAYLGSYYNNTSTNSPITFSFTGPFIRIIGVKNTTGAKTVKVNLDGVTETISVNGALTYNVIIYERTDLEDKRHTISLSREDGYMWFDAVDIASSARIYHPDEVENASELVVGKRIRCNYSAGLNSVGTFRNLGRETTDFISGAIAPGAPNGDFYFIMVDNYNGEIRLLPDRNIQSAITWDALNVAGIATTTGIDLTPKGLVSAIPAMTSNVSEYGRASASSIYSAAGDAWRAFDKTTAGWLMLGGQWNNAWIRYDFTSPKTIKGYSIMGGNTNMDTDYMKSWRFEASNDNGATWVVLDAKSGYTFGIFEKRTFSISNDTPYTAYRIVITGNGGGGYVRTAEIDFLEEVDQIKGRIRLMTGGYSSTDTNNEWDRYIVGSSLNGKITPGDNSVWNWMSRWSLTTSTNTFGTSYRTVRGSGSASGSGYVVATEMSAVNENFRPMLILTQIINNKYLIQDGSDIKIVDGTGWRTVGAAPVTEQMYLTYGMDDLTLITESLVNQLTASVVKILAWTDMLSIVEKKISISALPSSRVVFPEGDITLPAQGIEGIEVLIQSAIPEEIKIISSVDGGQSWKTYSSGAWVSVDAANISDVVAKGMIAGAFNGLTEAQWAALIGSSNKIRFAYYLDNYSKVDQIKLKPKSSTNATPSVLSIKASFDEMTVEGRLKDLERLNVINIAKLNFKSNALLLGEKYKLYDLVIDTFETDAGTDKSLTTATYDTINKRYNGPGDIVTPYELVSGTKKTLLITADATAGVTFAYSLDDGATWTVGAADTLLDISQKNGTQLRVKASVPSGDYISALAYSWV